MLKEPKTKADLMNRLLQLDFNGDLRTLSPEGVVLKRVSNNALALIFPVSGHRFVLRVQKPRTEEMLAKSRRKGQIAIDQGRTARRAAEPEPEVPVVRGKAKQPAKRIEAH